MSDSIPGFKKTVLELIDTGVYTKKIRIGPKTSGRYKYVVKTITKLLRREHTTESGNYKLQNVDVQRDILGYDINQKHLQSGFIMHLNDILKYQHYFSLESVCMQLEQICNHLSLCNSDDVLLYMLGCIHSGQTRNNLLLAVTIGYLYRLRLKPLKQLIKLDEAKLMLLALSSHRLDMFPVTWHDAVVPACKMLCEIANPSTYSLCFFINEYFTFLGEQRVQTELNNHFRNSNTEICLENDYSPDDLLQRLIDDTSLTKAKEVKATLLKMLPVKVSMYLFKTYYTVLKEDDQILQICKTRFVEALKSAQTNNNLKYLLEFPILIDGTNFITDAEIKQQIEHCVIKVIQSTTTNVDTAIEHLFINFLNKGHCFVAKDLQCDLLKILAKSRKRCLSNIVLRLMDCQGFRNSFESRHDQVCLSWLENYIQCEKIDSNCCDLLIIFRGASAILEQNIGTEVEEDILYFVSENARKRSAIADFFEVIDNVETLFKSLTRKRNIEVLQKLFVETFYLKLTANTTKKPEELLRLCLTNGSHTVPAGYVRPMFHKLYICTKPHIPVNTYTRTQAHTYTNTYTHTHTQ